MNTPYTNPPLCYLLYAEFLRFNLKKDGTETKFKKLISYARPYKDAILLKSAH
ncbi:hypothetical protein GCM10007203_25160 [Staphylococcus nepalensis]|nr:hypothetical protein GCM10007203_25160 [Staphylococcus nepalensis]